MKKQLIFDTARSIPLFSSLTDAEVSSLIASGSVQSFNSGDIISSDRAITVVLRGTVAATKHNGEKNLLMRTFGTGSITGVSSLFCKEGDTLSVLTALSPTTALIIDQTQITELIHSNGAFATDYIGFLTSRIRFLNSRIKAYTASGAEAKLAFHLLISDEAEKGEVELHVSYSRLADMLDIGRASLYRALDSLAAKGVAVREKRTIKILDRSALQRISDGDKKLK